MTSDPNLKDIITALPDKPGIYQFINIDGKIIYVGKAKSVRKRVTSYFNDRPESGKTAALVRKIKDIKYILVETELDALLLENNLIKEHQPRYNIMLKDDKTYPWLCLKNERFPRIFPTRNPVKDGSLYFGPYASVKMMNTLLGLVKQLYTLRTCSYQLSPENIKKEKFKVCLEYHIGNCQAPCVGKQEETDYARNIEEIKQIIKGDITAVVQHLKALLKQYAEAMEFEKAQFVKNKIDILERYQGRSTIVNPAIHNVDVYSLEADEDAAYVNFLKVINGAIIQGHTIEMKKKLDETAEELLKMAIVEFRERYGTDAREILVPFAVDLEVPGVAFAVPQRGDKKKLLELSERNAKQYRAEKLRQEELTNPERHASRILEQMKKDLRLTELPRHIECFDNSNIMGAHPVAACVVFKNAKPSKKDYRHFNIKTVEGPNDFASMEEIIYRRYRRMMEENQPLPQLIIIDGGKGQLSAALKSLEELSLRGKVGIISIAKKLEEIYYPGDSLPLYLDKKSETLKVIQHLRNEAHRFGITHHRKKRAKASVKSELDNISGIGPATAQALLRHFKSVKRIKEASFEEISKVIGPAKAGIVTGYLKK